MLTEDEAREASKEDGTFPMPEEWSLAVPIRSNYSKDWDDMIGYAWIDPKRIPPGYCWMLAPGGVIADADGPIPFRLTEFGLVTDDNYKVCDARDRARSNLAPIGY